MQTIESSSRSPLPPEQRRPGTGIWALGERLTWVAAGALLLSSLTGWYVGSGDGLSLVVIALGAVATVVVLVRLISIPEEFLPADGRGVGIWISLVAAVGVIVAGLMEAAEEL